MSTIKVNNLESSTGGGVAAKLTSVNGGAIGTRNLIINGAMNVAQRGTSSTTNGYQTVDRFTPNTGGTDETPTYAQVDVASGTGPYTSGFRKAFKVTNGNQASGAGGADFIQVEYRIESQDLAQSGWNYTSSSSDVTLSFWIKSSVSKDFQIVLRTVDGTSQSFQFETPTLSADTWTKVTKTISGNSNLQFDNNNDVGLRLFLFPYIGTDYTDSGNTLNDWVASASNTYGVVDGTSWYTTNDATFEITGLQLEVGSESTPFPHKTFTEDLALCERYFQIVFARAQNDYQSGGPAAFGVSVGFHAKMRVSPTVTITNASNAGVSNIAANQIHPYGLFWRFTGSTTSGGTTTQMAEADLQLSSEL